MRLERSTADAPPQAACEKGGKYLVFYLGDEEFGISVLKVREIMAVQKVTAVPQTPPYIKGVINLRGKVIPVVDLRIRFGLPEIEQVQTACIVVIEVQDGTDVRLMGVTVDGVAEVLSLASADIEDTPEFGSGVAIPYLLGIAKVKGEVKILLQIDRVLIGEEAWELNALAQ